MSYLPSKIDQSALARSYNPLQQEFTLRNTLKSLFPSKRFDHYTKKELHSFINKIILNEYRGEEYYKYQLAKNYLKQQVIAGFEVRVGKSRSDFLLINGSSHNFEIKSRLDDLKRLESQISSYIDVFDYNYVVTDTVHIKKVLSILPDSIGIWTFSNSKKKVIRSAKLNNNIDPISQLKLMTVRELIKEFGTYEIKVILSQSSSQDINFTFKRILKQKYAKRWDFICGHWESILPIDLQFFFNKNIEPSIIY